MVRVKTGLEVALSRRALFGRDRVGLIVHPASIDRHLAHAADLLHQRLAGRLTALLGPQHGIRGETQDNMIEWRGFVDPATGLPVHSLYGETRKPSEDMLASVDTLVFDLQDVGTRVYTFIWTLALAMQACAEFGRRLVVLDRPNPLGGLAVEGNLLAPGFRSFVGLHPLPMRHGLTVGEIALFLRHECGIDCHLEVIPMRGWRRAMRFDQTGLPWVMPSPNMPTLDTALVYPGTVIFEGTNISEGRGTTRPFELVGAPWLDARQLAASLEKRALPGVHFRPAHFQPTFHKWQGQLCGGVQLHVTQAARFEPYRTGLLLLEEIVRASPEKFAWKPPPYEYERERQPIDCIVGTDAVRTALSSGRSIEGLIEAWRAEAAAFRRQRRPYLLYRE